MPNKKIHFILCWDLKANKYSNWINIGYLISMIKEKTDFEPYVSFYDFNDVETALKDTKNNQYEIVGLSIIQDNFNFYHSYMNQVKNDCPNLKIIIGNITANYYAEYIMQTYPSVDYIVMNEGELTICELLQCIEDGIGLESCKGIYYRNNNKIIKNDNRPLIVPLDTLPFPERSFIKHSFSQDVYASRGCDGSCSFCDVNSIFKGCTGPKMRLRSISNVMMEIDDLVKNQKCRSIEFMDATFCSHANILNRLEELYNGLLSRDYWINLNLNMRISQINQDTIDLIFKLAKVGLSKILLGVESLNEEDLILYKKNISISTIKEKYELLRQNGLLSKETPVFIKGSLINFNPYSSIKSLKENVKFAKEYFSYSDITVLFSRLRVFGSSDISEVIQKDGLMYTDIRKPFSDYYSYKFKNDYIQDIYDLVEYCNKKLINKEFLNIFPFYKRYTHFCNNNNMKEGYDLYWEYNKKITLLTSELFENTIEYVVTEEKSIETCKVELEEQIENINNIFLTYQQPIEEYGKKLAIEYFRL